MDAAVAEPGHAPRSRSSSEPQRRVLGARERSIATAIAEASMPSAGRLPGGGSATVDRYERLLADMPPSFARAVRSGLWAAEAWPIPRTGRPLSALPPEARARQLEMWADASSRYERWLLRAVLTPLKSAHFDDARMFDHVGCKRGEAPRGNESASWTRRITDGRSVDADLDLRCEVVVVGTGAGGAAAAYELARRGRAVLLLEAGDYHARSAFTGRAVDAYAKMYLGLGSTIAIGNVAAPVWAGRGVGGSTTINSGTCYRAPDWTLARWAKEGLTMMTPASLAPYYERVEAMLGVEEARREHLGGSARVIARGASLMGLSHKPLRRNAPGCDGQGVCCFGCPTGAKRSTDVSYVPEALRCGAELVTGASVRTVDVVDGRARGVTARLASGRTLKVRADVVVVAGGALLTPLLLDRSGLCKTSGWLGKNLSIHPASKVMALFGERIDMSRGIPQSYAIDAYAREGLMFEGASTPLDVAAVAVPWVGRRFMEVMDRYPELATFGFMIQDRSRGSVRSGPGGTPLIRYDLGPEDTAQMKRGFEILSEVFLRAGAERVLPMVRGCEEIRTEADLARLRRAELRPGDFEVTAFHPLGTCRMGVDPSRSCVDPDGEAHDVPGLFVADGSAVPSSLGVNPQMTIMAFALRSAEAIDERLSERSHTRSPEPSAPRAPLLASPRALALRFDETMRGTWEPEGAPGDRRELVLALSARSRSWRELVTTGWLDVAGTITAGGLARERRVEGRLGVHVLGDRRVRYDLVFEGDDGRAYRFSGQKRVRPRALLRTMTFLPGRIATLDGEEAGFGEVRFDLRDLGPFLRSFRVARA